MDDCNEELIVKIAVLQRDAIHLREAIKLQASEYERRLSELNHAHAQSTADKNKFATLELMYSKFDEIARWRSDYDKWRWASMGGAAVGGGMLGAMFSRWFS